MRNRTVVVEQLPEITTMKQARLFLEKLESDMSSNCPRIVLDCSSAPQVNRSLLYTLLCCLEETIKRNGDVKLASISSEARTVLELTGIRRLFEIYGTVTEAVMSFLPLAPSQAGMESVSEGSLKSA